MAVDGIKDYLKSEEARKRYLSTNSGGYLTRGESTFNLATIMKVFMDVIAMTSKMEGQTQESRELFAQCIDSIRDLHKMLIVNSGSSPEQIHQMLKDAGHIEDDRND